MKNITIKSLTAVALLASLSSCSDFLDQSSPSSLDGKNIFSTYEYAQGTIANIYQEFGEQNYRARAIWYGYNTDIEYYNSSEGRRKGRLGNIQCRSRKRSNEHQYRDRPLG